MKNAYGVETANMNHAHSSVVGKNIGVARDGKIVAGVIIEPLPGQNDNVIRVRLVNGAVKEIKYMDSYAPGFVNSVL